MRTIKNKASISMMLLILSTLFISPSFTQTITNDSTGLSLYDDLLDHLVGKWEFTSVAHAGNFAGDLEASWVLNHQFLLIHLTTHEIIPWLHVPMEYYEYIGYNHYKQRYVIHEMTVVGDEDKTEGFYYGSRDGNDFKMVAKFNSDTSIVQHTIWQPENNTWLIQSRQEINGKESEVFLEIKLTAMKPQ